MQQVKWGALNNRGVALLIALLVTALLVALVFEFAYGTRVSLRAAANFRDSQRAYYLARAGVNVFLKYRELQESTPQGEWSVAPVVSAGDTELRIRWEDEKGKINIKGYLTDVDTVAWLVELFRIAGVDQGVLDKIIDEFKGRQVQMLGELHQAMSDEEFFKVSRYLTVSTGQKMVNVNTASEDVLKSMGIEPALIMPSRPYKATADISGIDAIQTKKGIPVKSSLDVTSDIYTVYSYATVGEYTRRVEAVVDRRNNSVSYWRSL